MVLSRTGPYSNVIRKFLQSEQGAHGVTSCACCKELAYEKALLPHLPEWQRERNDAACSGNGHSNMSGILNTKPWFETDRFFGTSVTRSNGQWA